MRPDVSPPRQASAEKDHEKLLDLIQQVIEKYNEERRRLRRIEWLDMAKPVLVIESEPKDDFLGGACSIRPRVFKLTGNKWEEGRAGSVTGGGDDSDYDDGSDDGDGGGGGGGGGRRV
jgi:hypothetical protein